MNFLVQVSIYGSCVVLDFGDVISQNILPWEVRCSISQCEKAELKCQYSKGG